MGQFVPRPERGNWSPLEEGCLQIQLFKTKYDSKIVLFSKKAANVFSLFDCAELDPLFGLKGQVY